VTGVLGDEAGARGQASRAVAVGERDRSGLVSLTLALVLEAGLHYLCADPSAALLPARRAVAAAHRAGYAELEAIGSVVLAWSEVRAGRGKVGSVRSALEQVPAAVQVEALHQWGMVADAALHAGRYDDVLDAVDRGLDAGEATGARMWLPELHRLRGEAQLHSGSTGDAADSFRRATDLAEGMGALLVLRRLARRR
jgi:hypothetical protein